jgi:hypothetical protein
MLLLRFLATSLFFNLTTWSYNPLESYRPGLESTPLLSQTGQPQTRQPQTAAPTLAQWRSTPWVEMVEDANLVQRSAETQPDTRIDEEWTEVQVNADYTYSKTYTTKMTVLTTQGINALQRSSSGFYPESQAVELLEAYVIQPDGEKLSVMPQNIFTRPSPESQSAPGFTSRMSTTVVFPRLQVGSQIIISWKFVQKQSEVFGFHYSDSPAFYSPTTRQHIRILLPANLKLKWRSQGNYKVTDETQGDRRVITAMLQDQSARLPENAMVSLMDVSSLFLVSSLENWQEIGTTYWQRSVDRAKVTPDVQRLADQITAGTQGIEAARAIYDWVTQRINYVAVYLDLAAGYVPHTADEIIQNGYGDCKDHVVLMQSLLQAKGIKSYPVLVSSGYSFLQRPLPMATTFNHAMIYLPDYNIFANPTNRYAAFGELGVGQRGKFVVIADEQGRTATIPTGVAQDNRYSISSTVAIDANGSIQGESELQLTGDFRSGVRFYLAADTPAKLAEGLLSRTPEGGEGTLQATSDLNQLDQSITAKGKWSSPYGIAMGQQVYLTTPVGLDLQNLARLRGYITLGDRQYPLVVGAKDLTWTHTITLPPGYRVSHVPDTIQFSNAAGQYTSRYVTQGDKVLVQRQLVINQDVYSPEEYAAFRSLMYNPVNDVRSVIVLDKQ